MEQAGRLEKWKAVAGIRRPLKAHRKESDCIGGRKLPRALEEGNGVVSPVFCKCNLRDRVIKELKE